MIIVNIIVAIILSVLILKDERPYRKSLIYFCIGIFLLRNTEIVGTLTIYRFLVFIMFLKLLLNRDYFIPYIKRYPFIWLLVLLFINHAFIGFEDSRLSFTTALGRFFFRFLSTFFLCLVGYLYIHDLPNFKHFLRTIYIIGICTALYSVFVLLVKHDPISMLLGTYDSTDYGGRLRVSSFTGYGTNGFICAVIGIISFLNPYNLLKNKQRYILLGLCLFTVLVSGFRINIIIFASGLLAIFTFKLKKYTKTILITVVLLFVSYISIPYITNFVDQTLLMFSNQSDLEGSSMEMRNMQYEIAYSYFLESPLWGHGFSYFAENIADSNTKDLSNGGLMGGEGYYILMLIEEGGIEIVLASLFFIFYLTYSLKGIQNSILKPIVFSLMLMFIVYCIGTRPDDNWFYLYPILGAMTKIIVLENENIRNNARVQRGTLLKRSN